LDSADKLAVAYRNQKTAWRERDRRGQFLATVFAPHVSPCSGCTHLALIKIQYLPTSIAAPRFNETRRKRIAEDDMLCTFQLFGEELLSN
jgi:hypothetical protein